MRTRVSARHRTVGMLAAAAVAGGVVACAPVGMAAAPAVAERRPHHKPSPSASVSASPTPSISPSTSPSPSPSPSVSPSPSASPGGWPDASNTGVPAGLALHTCPLLLASSGTYDACEFDGDVTVYATDVHITRSLIKGQVAAGPAGLVIADTTIACGCPADDTHTPSAIMESNYTLLRVNLYGSGHGAAVKSNVVIRDSWIHGLGGQTLAHKDGIYSGDGTNVVIDHNNIECNDGKPAPGCTAAIGLLVDFAPITYYTITDNLLNTTGSYCLYGGGGPKPYHADHITFTGNHFGVMDYPRDWNGPGTGCGYYGPVAYWDVSKPGMVWSGNVWDDSGAPVDPAY